MLIEHVFLVMFSAGSARSRQSYARPPATQQNGQHDVSEVAPSEAKKPGGIPVPGKSWDQPDVNNIVGKSSTVQFLYYTPHSCIDIYSYSCLNPLSNEQKSMFKSGDSRAV